MFGNSNGITGRSLLPRTRESSIRPVCWSWFRFIEETFGLKVDDEELIPENLDSVDNLVGYLQRKGFSPSGGVGHASNSKSKPGHPVPSSIISSSRALHTRPARQRSSTDGLRVSYAEVNGQANAWRNGSSKTARKEGTGSLLILENGFDYIAGYYGTLKAGAVAVPLSPDLKAAALGPIISELAPKAVIATHRSEVELQALEPGPAEWSEASHQGTLSEMGNGGAGVFLGRRGGQCSGVRTRTWNCSLPILQASFTPPVLRENPRGSC